MARYTHLDSPMQLGELQLRNGMVMAPCTRCFCPGFLPTRDMAAYYARRAASGVGLIISEGTVVCQRGSGYPDVPGIWSDGQVRAWRPVTQAVHEAGGRMACQLWHVGAVAHPVTTGGPLPESPSGLSPEGPVRRLRGAHGEALHYGASEAMSATRIKEVVEIFAAAAGRALEAGFDAVEIHGAHGYLIDQFINLSWNMREDEWGGQGRCRLAEDITRAVVAEAGPGRVIFRFSPATGASGKVWKRPTETLPLLLDTLWGAGLRILHASHGNFDAPCVPAELAPLAQASPDGMVPLHAATRAHWQGQIIGVGSLSPGRADEALATGEVDACAFGRLLIANPDLPSRLRMDLDPRPYDPAMLETLF